MTQSAIVEYAVQFPKRERTEGVGQCDSASPPRGRLPRVTRWMALALRLDELVRTGQIRSYRELASLGQVTPARITQILNLLNLAPDLQERLLFLPRMQRGRDPIILADLQPIARALLWRQQRWLWRRRFAK